MDRSGHRASGDGGSLPALPPRCRLAVSAPISAGLAMDVSPRDQRWRVEYRCPIEGQDDLLILARSFATATAVRNFVLETGERAFGGEYRISAPGKPSVLTRLTEVRRWRPDVSELLPAARGIWLADLQTRRARDDLLFEMRVAVTKASRAGVLAMADGLALVRLASTLMAR